MSSTLDISDVNKLDLLRALWNRSEPAHVFNELKQAPPSFDETKAVEQLAKKGKVDYFCGRLIKTDLSGRKADPTRFDEAYGDGTFASVLSSLGKHQRSRAPRASIKKDGSGVGKAVLKRMSKKDDKKLHKQCLKAIDKSILYPMAKIKQVQKDGSVLVDCFTEELTKVPLWIIRGRGDGQGTVSVCVAKATESKNVYALETTLSKEKLKGAMVFFVPDLLDKETIHVDNLNGAVCNFPKTQQASRMAFDDFRALCDMYHSH